MAVVYSLLLFVLMKLFVQASSNWTLRNFAARMPPAPECRSLQKPQPQRRPPLQVRSSSPNMTSIVGLSCMLCARSDAISDKDDMDASGTDTDSEAVIT